MSPRRWRRAPLLLLLPLLAAFGPNDEPWSPPQPFDDGSPHEVPDEQAAARDDDAPARQTLTVDVQLLSRTVRVELEAPGDWIPLAPSASRAELMGPDRRSRLYLRAMPAAGGRSCPAVARDYAREVIRSWGGPPRSRVVERTALGAEVTFELARRDPRPGGELVLGRVFCQEGVLVVATCAGPTDSQDVLRPLCGSALSGVHLADDAVALAR